MVKLRDVVAIALGLVIGLALALKVPGWVGGISGLFGAGAAPPPVHVEAAELERDRVKEKPGLLERVQLGRIQPTQTRIALEPSAAGKAAVDHYCTPAPVGRLVQTSANSLAAATPDTMKRTAVLPDFGGRAGRGRLRLQSTLSDGRRWDQDYRVHGRWTWTSSGDSVIVESERLWSRLLRGAAKCVLAGGVGGAAGWLLEGRTGAVIGAGVGCGTTIVF